MDYPWLEFGKDYLDWKQFESGLPGALTPEESSRHFANFVAARYPDGPLRDTRGDILSRAINAIQSAKLDLGRDDLLSQPNASGERSLQNGVLNAAYELIVIQGVAHPSGSQIVKGATRLRFESVDNSDDRGSRFAP